MVEPTRPVRRRIRAIRAFLARGVLHLLVVVLVVGSGTLGALSAQGALILDGTTIRVVAPARGAVSEQMAAAQNGEITIELQPHSGADATSATGAMDAMDGTRVLSTPAPEPVAAIPLPAPPPVRSGAVGTSLPWAGPTGYVDGDGSLTWPVPGGYVSQYFWGGHQAVDIAHAYGGAVLAADTGTVVAAGWQTNGGGLGVTIQHSDGRVTGYNHLGSVLVSAGQGVVRGEQIAAVGCTGICTGPHVHFAVIVNGVLVNPLRYL